MGTLAAESSGSWRPIARLRAIARGPHLDTSADLQSYRVLVASLFSSPTSMVLSNTVGSLVPLFCWYASGWTVFLWFAAAAGAITVVRAWTMARFKHAPTSEMSFAETRAWDREYFVGATAFSCVLGIANFFALAYTESVPCHIITIVCGIAFSAGYVARNAGRPYFVIVQLLCFCVPMAVGLYVSIDPFYDVISLYIVLFALTNVSVVFSLNRNLLQLAAATKQANSLASSIQRKNVTLDLALNSMTHGLCMFSSDLRLELWNTRFLRLYGLDADEIVPGTELATVARRLVRAQLLTPQSAADLEDMCARTARLGQPAEKEILTEGGQIYVVGVEVTADGGILLLTEDASARKAAAAQIERMAHCDNLTGLPNRFRFNELFRAALASSRPAGKLVLLYLDLDNFKVINDSLGHEAGDDLLVVVGQRLGQLGWEGAVVARFGGDEFLILADVPDAAAAMTLAERAIEAMSRPVDLDGKTLAVTSSVGIAVAGEHGREQSEILRAADMALYAAKAAGRNRAVLYTPEIAATISKRRALETDLRDATRSGRLFLHYQPIVDARTDEVRSYEALMRWNHPERGIIPPNDFIPIAEETGHIVAMGAWALRQACMDAKDWPDQVSVAVNVSAFQFKNTGRLIDAVKDALLISGLKPSRLELEVTESLLIEDQDATLEAIRVLRRLGVRFSLDDFGSGYSSLGYLARYPFSKVKIDRAFAQHITSDSSSRSIVEVVCQLAHKLGMRVVVEGIETEEQRREIVALGAEQAQGWLFGRPAAIESLGAMRRDAA